MVPYGSGLYRMERYTGTMGSTQGERKDTNPAPKATKSGIFSITILDTGHQSNWTEQLSPVFIDATKHY